MKLFTLFAPMIGLAAALPTKSFTSTSPNTARDLVPGDLFRIGLYSSGGCTDTYTVLTITDDGACYPLNAGSVNVLDFDQGMKYNSLHGFYGEGCAQGWWPVPFILGPQCQEAGDTKSLQVSTPKE